MTSDTSFVTLVDLYPVLESTTKATMHDSPHMHASCSAYIKLASARDALTVRVLSHVANDLHV